jgi:tRNA(Ile)-lysidine synthase
VHDVVERVAEQIERRAPIPREAPVACLVSGGADSTCLWHVLRALGRDVRAVHVHHGVRGAEADADARFCVESFAATVVHVEPVQTEAELRALRYAATAEHPLRATGHTASDQIETVLLRLLASGAPRGIKPCREDGVVRPLLTVWREETQAYCRAHGLAWREDASNPATRRGLVRDRVLPLLEDVDPRARASLLALATERPRLPRALEASLVELLASRHGTTSADLGDGVRAVRSYDELRLDGAVRWGPWRIETEAEGLVVRARRPGDRLAGRRKKVQDLLVDAKVPRDERDAWPLVARADGAIVLVPGIAAAPGWDGVVDARREEG